MKNRESLVILRQYHLLLLPAALTAIGTLQLVPLALADGTPANTAISNTATATYQDPNNLGTTLNATSNTVTVTVAEVAGITSVPGGITEAPSTVANPGPNQGNGVIDTSDVVYFDYTLTNVGNDPTQFFIPGAPSQVLGAAFDAMNTTTAAGPIQIVAVNGTNLTTPVNVPAAGNTTGALLGLPNGSLNPGGTVKVRVPVRVTATTSGAPIKVVLGDTGPNDNSAATQNQPYVANASNLDVYTQDNPDGTPGEVAGNPSNGDTTNHRQEASAEQQTFLSATLKAFATVLKTENSFTPASNGTTAPNGTLTYGLSLRVERNSPNASLIAADLQGTQITVDGTAAPNLILVSDVVPANTTIVTTGPNAPVAPAGWTTVYSIDDPTTATALQAAWQTAVPTGTIRRIGFIHNAAAKGAIAKGTTVTGFLVSVTTNVSATTGGTIANIAQVFGQTTPGNGQTLIYDESGDQQPNNYNADNTPGAFSNVTPAQFNSNNPGAGQTASDANENKGIANPATQGVDNNNNNMGTGPGGEDNVFAVQLPSNILNGPNGQPGAVGLTNNNDDFTNLSTPVPANTAPGSTISPAPVTFTNTVSNSGTASLTNVLLRPLTPTTPTDLPNGTTVTITLGSNTGVYTYNSTTGQFQLTSGTPISIPSLAPGVSLNYTTTVALPSGTPLSTDINRGFPVPVVAFTDNNGNGQYDPGTDVGNVTIDRTYTGYLKWLKQARMLDANGNQVAPASGYTNDSTVLNQFTRSGYTIEYQIQYKNISETASGTGDVILNASNTTITEDGTAAPNNWFGPTKDAFPNNPNGSAAASAGTVTVTVQSGDIKVYVNNVGTVVPSSSTGNPNGTFTFQRKIN